MDDGSGAQNGLRRGLVEPAHRGDERITLVGFLGRQRDLVAWKLAGATAEVLGTVSTPTGMTALGVVQHLTVVERSWLRSVFAGEDLPPTEPASDWRVAPGTTTEQVLAEYAAEAGRCDAVVAAAPSLDAVAARAPMSLRWILLHLVEETARHVGHLDLLREQADGATGEDPEDPDDKDHPDDSDEPSEPLG